MPPMKLKIEKNGNVLETIILNVNNGNIIIPKNNITDKETYPVKLNGVYAFKKMIRRAAEKTYGGRVGIIFLPYQEEITNHIHLM